jgi:hypothetical protein
MYHFISWATFKPNATWFNVPDVCKNATDLQAGTEDINVMPGSDSHLGTCAIAASTAARIATASNGMNAAQLITNAMGTAGVNLPTDFSELIASGSACVGGPKVGDVFFDDVSAAVWLGGDEFAECKIAGGRCTIIPQRDFLGGCRRFC